MDPLQTFEASLERARALGVMHAALKDLTTAVIDPSDLLRAQIVLAVSSLDHLVHEITVRGMLEIYDGRRGATPHYLKFKVPINAFGATSAALSRGAFESAIRESHSYLSFQRPEKIADAIRLFSTVSLWQEVAAQLSMPVDDLKGRLDLAVDRRNKIAHEADLDPSYPGQRWPIVTKDAEGVVDLIEDAGKAVHSVACSATPTLSSAAPV